MTEVFTYRDGFTFKVVNVTVLLEKSHNYRQNDDQIKCVLFKYHLSHTESKIDTY